jgi:threonine dehydrogenase-like Zn-dependent dehydrogenase
MKISRLSGPRTIGVEMVECPRPGEGEVLVRLEGCGVCASSLPLWQGRPWFEYPRPPGEPGHEGWGVVVETGPGVEGVAEGDRVALLSQRAFAEYDVCSAHRLVVIPPELEAQPLPAEPLGCVMNILRRSDVVPGDTVAVVGIGFLGALLVELLVKRGARVIALSRRPSSLQEARRRGADEVVSLDDPHQAVDRVRDIAGGEGCPRVLEVTGAQTPLDVAGKISAVGGRLVIAGYHQDPRSVDMQDWNWKGLDVINAHERDDARIVAGMHEAVAAVAEGAMDPFPLFTRIPLARLSRAFVLLENRPPGFFKALVHP